MKNPAFLARNQLLTCHCTVQYFVLAGHVNATTSTPSSKVNMTLGLHPYLSNKLYYFYRYRHTRVYIALLDASYRLAVYELSDQIPIRGV
jgi:hypothetical protein